MAMYAGFYRRLHTSSVSEVREMAYYCLGDMRSNTARNISRICDELGLEVSNVTPQAVMQAAVKGQREGGGEAWEGSIQLHPRAV